MLLLHTADRGQQKRPTRSSFGAHTDDKPTNKESQRQQQQHQMATTVSTPPHTQHAFITLKRAVNILGMARGQCSRTAFITKGNSKDFSEISAAKHWPTCLRAAKKHTHTTTEEGGMGGSRGKITPRARVYIGSVWGRVRRQGRYTTSTETTSCRLQPRGGHHRNVTPHTANTSDFDNHSASTPSQGQ